jgi:hypothetical protein
LTLAGALRDWRYKRDLDKWVKRNAYPDTVQRKYWTTSEYEEDAVRLKAHGYTVAAEEDAEPNIEWRQNRTFTVKTHGDRCPYAFLCFTSRTSGATGRNRLSRHASRSTVCRSRI